MPKSLKNKKIIISAGASGIGWATAKICLSRGATVYLCDIDNKSLNKIKKHPLNNKRLFSYEYDASDEYEVSNFFNKISRREKTTHVQNINPIAGVTSSIGSITINLLDAAFLIYHTLIYTLFKGLSL